MAQAAPTAGIGAARSGAIETDPSLARDREALEPGSRGSGAIPSLDAPLAVGSSRQATSPGAGGDTIADADFRPGALVFESIAVAGADQNRAAEAFVGTPFASAPDAIAGRFASPAPDSAAFADAIFAGLANGAPNPAWPGVPISMSEGARRLGVPLVAAPDLAILSIKVVEAAEGPIVHLRQRLRDGTTLLLVQRVGPAAALPPIPAAMNTADIRRGSLYVTGVAQLGESEIRNLLDDAR